MLDRSPAAKSEGGYDNIGSTLLNLEDCYKKDLNKDEIKPFHISNLGSNEEDFKRTLRRLPLLRLLVRGYTCFSPASVVKLGTQAPQPIN